MYNDPFLQATGSATTLPTIGHLIDGKLVAGGSRMQDVFNPATGRAEKRLLLADTATISLAIASAQAAYPAWRATPPLKRARVMGKLKQLLEQHADKICALLTAEHGKVVGDALGELQRGIENVEYASYAPELLKGEHSKNVGPSIDSWSEFQPLGVTAGITAGIGGMYGDITKLTTGQIVGKAVAHGVFQGAMSRPGVPGAGSPMPPAA